MAKFNLDINSKKPIKILGDQTFNDLLLKEFVRQKYLSYNKIQTHPTPPAFEFKWGFRSNLEFRKIDVLRFVCDIYGDNMKPEFWQQQFQQAQE